MNLWIWKETSIFCHILLQNIDFEREGGATTIRFLYHIGVTHTEGKWGRILTHNHPLLSEDIPFWEEKCVCKKERVWGDKCKWKGNIGLEAHTKMYSFTCSQKHNSAFTPFWSCLYCMPLCHMAFKVVSKLDLDDTLGDYDKFM